MRQTTLISLAKHVVSSSQTSSYFHHTGAPGIDFIESAATGIIHIYLHKNLLAAVGGKGVFVMLGFVVCKMVNDFIQTENF